MSSASKDALRKFAQKLIVPSNGKKGPHGYTYYAPRTDFFVDNVICPNYFESKIVQTFGTVGFSLDKCEIWFAKFLFLKMIIDIIVTLMGTLQIHRKKYTENLSTLGKYFYQPHTNFSWFGY